MAFVPHARVVKMLRNNSCFIFEIWKPIVSPEMRRAWRRQLEADWTPFASPTIQRAWRQKPKACWTPLGGERKRKITTCFVSLPFTSFRALSEWISTRNLESWDRHLSIIKTKRRCYMSQTWSRSEDSVSRVWPTVGKSTLFLVVGLFAFRVPSTLLSLSSPVTEWSLVYSRSSFMQDLMKCFTSW